MAALQYKFEYLQGAIGPTDDGVFIQLRTDVPAYQPIITKELYFSAQNTTTTALATALFGINGVVRLSTQAWRVYIEKSPVFQWDEVLGVPYQPGIALPDETPVNPSVMAVLNTFTSTDSVSGLGGSGITLPDADVRRGF
jgi:hypothetical protein